MTGPERPIRYGARRCMVLLTSIVFSGALLAACSRGQVGTPTPVGDGTLLLRYECVPGPIGMPPDRSCFGPSFSLYSDGRVIYRDASRLDTLDRPTLAAWRIGQSSPAPVRSGSRAPSPTPSAAEPALPRSPIPGVDIDSVAIEAAYQTAVLTPAARDQLMSRAQVLRELARVDRTSATRGDAWFYDEYAISIDNRLVSIANARFGASSEQAARLADLQQHLASYSPGAADVVASPQPFESSAACAWLRPAGSIPSSPWPWPELSPDDFETVNSVQGQPRRLSPAEAARVAPEIAGGIIKLTIEGGSPKSAFALTARPLMPDEECSNRIALTVHG